MSTEPAVYVNKSGRPIEIPADLIQLRRDWIDADHRQTEISRALPTNREIRDGERPAPTAEDIDRLTAARAELVALTRQIHGHLWWDTVRGERYDAERAMWAAAAQ